MKNIKLLKKSTFKLNSNVSAISLTNDIEDGIYCASENALFLSNESTSKKVVDDISDSVIFLRNGLSIYTASSNSIVSYDNYNGSILDRIEFPVNILNLSICPDESMLLVLTDDLMFTILSNELEILSDFDLEQSGFGTAASLSVGWGKKETQFHGKSGKDSRYIKEIVSDTSSFDSSEVFVSWKDDGEFFAVSWNCRSPLQSGVDVGARLMRVFSKDGILFSTSEAIATLENGLFWRSRGGLLATSCRSSRGLEVAFIEQNGLRHGGFVLYDRDDCKNKAVTSVEFSTGGEICAVTIRDTELKQTYLRLYTTDNYHWYLKQHIVVGGLERTHMLWSGDKLHMCTAEGSHVTYQWYQETDRSMVLNHSLVADAKSPNLVAVIDGKQLLMTPFEHCVVPPPYCAFTIDFEEYVSHVSLPTIAHLDGEDLSCLVQLSGGECRWLRLRRDASEGPVGALVARVQKGRKTHLYMPVSSLPVEIDNDINKVTWIDNNSFYGIFGNSLHLCKYNGTDITVTKLSHPDIELANVCQSDKTYIQDINGSVFTLSEKPEFLFKSSTFCQEILSVRFPSESENTLIGLSRRFNQLFVNNVLQSGSYLSVLALSNHIILTNVNQRLRCISLLDTSLKDFLHMLDDKAYSTKCDFDETLRLIEPGTEIVTCVATDSKIVLMMPRGNLETIHPRALILDDLKRSMEHDLYTSAIEKMRRHRVNLNLVYDHDPDRFMKNLEGIVRDCRKNDRLVLLISELSNENVTETMYKRFYDHANEGKEKKNDGKKGADKLNKVCSAIVTMLHSNGHVEEDYLFVVLTAYVRMSPSRADAALQLLCELKASGSAHLWDKGLKHLQYLISIDDLYRVALSTYDLRLTLQVAQKTQMDPKEYVEMLNDLSELPCEHYRRYKINMYLKRHERALECVAAVAADHWEETVELVTAHTLFVPALALFEVGGVHFTEISGLFAEHLTSRCSDLRAAGMVLLRTQDRTMCLRAAGCLQSALCWREWIAAARIAGLDKAEVDAGLRALAVRLHSVGRSAEAVTVYEACLRDCEAAATVALEALMFGEALRLLGGLPEGEKRLAEAADRANAAYVPQLEEAIAGFDRDLERLLEVREDFVRRHRETRETGDDEALPDYMSDTVSEASSARSCSSRGSRQSGRSQASSKVSRKPKKQLWSSKVGSQKEEVAIMERLFNSVRNTQVMTDDLKSFVEMLCYLNKVKEASQLVSLMNTLLSKQTASLEIIWDRFVFDSTFELHEYEYPISSHIRVSRGPLFEGRRRYLIDEEFLRSAPVMKTKQVAYEVCRID